MEKVGHYLGCVPTPKNDLHSLNAALRDTMTCLSLAKCEKNIFRMKMPLFQIDH